MDSLSALAPAKINLTLRVICRGIRGYHIIRSLVTQVELCDRVTVTHRPGPLRVECDDPQIPIDERNLAYNAAEALCEVAERAPADLLIQLEKHIPVGAGLGGGSTDAAAVLRLANELLGLGFDRETLAEMGAHIGADVPLFLYDSPSFISGRGDKVDQVGFALPGYATLIMPPLHCATGEVYRAWSRRCEPIIRPDSAELLMYRPKLSELMPKLYNDLEPAAKMVEPALLPLHAQLVKLADGPVRMTGSGASFFRLFDQQHEAQAFADLVTEKLDLPTAAVALRGPDEQ